MTINHKKRRTASSLPAGLVIGLLSGVLASVMLTAIFAYFIAMEKLAQESIGWCAMAVLFTGSCVSAWVSAKKVQSRTAMVCALGSGIYFLTMVGITALFFGGIYDGVGVSAVLIAVGCAAAFCLKKLKIPSNRVKKTYKGYL